MSSCCVPTCDSHSQGSLHRFPDDQLLREMWFEKCGVQPAIFDPNSCFVCSLHFVEGDFQTDSQMSGGLKILKCGVVPSLNLSKVKAEPLDDSFELESLETKGATVNSNVKQPSSKKACSLPQLIAIPHSVPGPSTHREGVSSLPATQNWPGNYGFNVYFLERNTKTITWTYSETKSKLYVDKNEPCPINFSTAYKTPEGTYIRAMALFSMSEHVSDVVHRCFNHASEESKKGVAEADHLIRCMCDAASYEVDPVTRRHSVVVPFENPPAGQLYSTYLFKFTCFGSCPGGPNRRPISVIFTLEKGNEVIGRKRVDVKICACPHRDRKNEEQGLFKFEDENVSTKRKEPAVLANLYEKFSFIKSVTYPSVKRAKVAPDKDGYYIIRTKDPKCYEFLNQFKTFYEICWKMKAISPELKKKLVQHSVNSDSSNELE